MDILSKILENYPDEGFLKADGFDAAIIGVSSTGCLVYSTDKVLEILMSRNNWSYDDAVEYFYYNIEGSYMGEKTPIFINLIN
jgi:hypothetical protein